MKLGIFGDSFGYQSAGTCYPGWPDLLASKFSVINHCRCGVSEYKILQQIKNSDLDQFDKIIVTHTSPTRVYVAHNPKHTDDAVYKDCDLILSNTEYDSTEFGTACKLYFKHIFDIDYAIDIHNMICREVNDLVKNQDVLHITHFDYDRCYQFPGLVNFYHHWLDHKGTVNHYNQAGNMLVYQEILRHLDV